MSENPRRISAEAIRSHGWLVYLVTGSVVLFAFLAVPPFRMGPIFNIIGLSGAVAILVLRGLHKSAHRLSWILVASGLVLFVAGDVITYNYVTFFGVEPPFPSVGDLLYLLVYPFLVAGIDLHDPELTAYEQLVAMAYPVMDLILLTVAVRLGLGTRRRSAGFYLMMASIAVLFVTDAIYGWVVLHGVYDNTTGYLEGGWGLFYLLFGAAALHPSTRDWVRPEREHEPKQPWLRLVILAAAALMAPMVNVLQSIRGEAVDVPIVSGAGAVVFILVLIRLKGLMVDITKYRRTARALSEAEAKYRLLVEGLPAVVYIADFGEKGNFTYLSPQIRSILGFTPEEFEAASFWRERIVPEDRERALSAELEVLRGEGRLECEYRISAKDGRIVWIREQADAVRDENGVPLYLQGVMYDVTEQKKVEERLVRSLETEKETNRVRSEFVLMINHELRTPLTSVVAGAQLMLDGSMSEGDRHVLAEDMVRDGRRLDGLISQVLAVAQVENQGLTYALTRTEVRHVLERIRMACGSNLVTIDVESSADAVIHTDSDALVQLVLSLADNAVTHGATKVTIQVTPTLRFLPMRTVGIAPKQPLFFIVRDDGPGIDPDFLPAVFEKFKKLSWSAGTGLGLHLARLMVEAMQGSISVYTGPSGTIMAVAVPLVTMDNHYEMPDAAGFESEHYEMPDAAGFESEPPTLVENIEHGMQEQAAPTAAD
jgi:PAS domain S-box-containing protein